jgi:hypothetical protein
MSLRQFKHIGSVGRFRACVAEGDVTFKKLTLIFGENGRGKDDPLFDLALPSNQQSRHRHR